MELVIKREVAQKVGYRTFVPYGISEEQWTGYKREEIVLDMGVLSTMQLDILESQLDRFPNVRGVPVLLHDIRVWKQVLKQGADEQKARTVRQFEPILKQYLLKVPGHRVYLRHEEGAMLCYYVKKTEYNPPNNYSNNRTPAHVTMSLVYDTQGGRSEGIVTFYADNVINVPVSKVLIDKGYLIETPELRAEYLSDKDVWVNTTGKIGKQYWGTGLAYSAEGDSWRRSNNVSLDKDGEESRVVIDIFHESDEKERQNYVDVSTYFWANAVVKDGYDPETDTNSLLPEGEDITLERPVIEIPVHPWVVVFHLQKHLRLRCHVRQLRGYVYDEHLSDKLILPDDDKELVKLLVDTKGGMFQDIVRGKGGGAVILLSGEPGTGKTLTAEVYAESEKRALYSIQCSQLGVNPEALEKNLMLVFDRAKRWNAVMLLDESDVYVHERGNNMAQNAIVGVFLRVLEYQGSVLFLTTNRPEDVDDAIASRCIARLVYGPPSQENAVKIWRVLAENSNLRIDDLVIYQVVKQNPEMTGRDIKNILKLASLMKGAEDGITLKMITFVQNFKPTGAVVVKEEERAKD